ncbi:MAG: DUF3854 domain-containing protein [Dehalococcoidia bacterium]
MKVHEPVLSPEHRRMLTQDSGLSDDIIAGRGYETITTKSRLHQLGFGHMQTNVPALLIPVFDCRGEVVLYQSRPDVPRIKDGKVIKYETMKGATMALDVHPSVRHLLGDPAVPLFITEGIKKGDALASRGACAIALLGVWNFRGTNDHGGKTILADWEYVALNGRRTFIVFDSDVMENPQVHGALVRLKSFLDLRGAV